jgi:translocator protein
VETARARVVDAIALVVAVAVPVAGGALVGVLTGPDINTWYQTVDRSPWDPPDWVFGPVWTVLYLLMGVASWLVWRRGWDTQGVRPALGLYGLQLGLNFLWPVVFFALRSPGWALLEIILLWLLILAVVVRFRAISPTAAVLLLPYLLWVSFAITLNAGVWWLNR